eukprot:TRINITY_DN141_c0_g1_i1.p1 TRINITY_DN141_c0_g1~~TRINITY_DN141_c0_g1_i1.p1  ORF type:complete len:623 (+),score=146.65 TRINITY_DN141_c0_g1_i1:1183-3051(+)
MYSNEKPPPSDKKIRAKHVCTACKTRKLRCDVENCSPCSQCKQRGLECEISISKKRGRKPKSGEAESLAPVSKRRRTPTKDHSTSSKSVCDHTETTSIVEETITTNITKEECPVIQSLGLLSQISLVRCPMVRLCVQLFNSVILPFFPFFDYDASDSWEAWSKLHNGSAMDDLESWDNLSSYLKHAIVFSTGLDLLGFPSFTLDSFMEEVIERNIDTDIPSKRVNGLMEVLLCKQYYHLHQGNHKASAKCSQHLISIYKQFRESIHMSITERMSVLSVSNGSSSNKDVMKIARLLNSKGLHPSNQVFLSSMVLIHLSDKGQESIAADDFNYLQEELNKTEACINKSNLKHDWVNQYKAVSYTTRATAYAINRFQQEAEFWAKQALSLCQSLFVPSHTIMLQFNFLLKILSKSDKQYNSKIVEQINQFCTSYSQKEESFSGFLGMMSSSLPQNFNPDTSAHFTTVVEDKVEHVIHTPMVAIYPPIVDDHNMNINKMSPASSSSSSSSSSPSSPSPSPPQSMYNPYNDNIQPYGCPQSQTTSNVYLHQHPYYENNHQHHLQQQLYHQQHQRDYVHPVGQNCCAPSYDSPSTYCDTVFNPSLVDDNSLAMFGVDVSFIEAAIPSN